jgi:dienelactone hydrolase
MSDLATIGPRAAGRALVLVLALVATAPALPQSLPGSPPVAGAPIAEPREVRITAPDRGHGDGDVAMLTRVHLPDGPGPFPVVIYSHGRSPVPLERQQMRNPIPAGHVRYWQRKGFAVVAPIRPGYGASGGEDRERSGTVFERDGSCRSQPDFETPARHAASATIAVLDWTRRQDWADPERIVLVGTSMGGLTSIATAATRPPGVVAYVNFSGGLGGNPRLAPQRSCGPERMEAAMRSFGATTAVPGLWLYAANDQYWGPEAPRRWHEAFARGGSRATFVQTAPLPDHDGHLLMLRGGRLWSVHVDAFIEALGF